jgi:hypothetical protein
LAILDPTVKTAALALAALAAAAPAARAGEARCWYENGVVVVTAEVAGVVGDYILDTAQPHTQLAETQAQGAGYESTTLVGEVRLAGVTVREQALEVADLDVRTGLLPTPIAGIIGADVLQGHVLDLGFAPCRLGFYEPRRAPSFRAARTMALVLTPAGAPVAPVAVYDGTQTRTVALTLSTGSDAPLRLSDALASADGRDRPGELYPNGVYRPTITALAFAGELFEDLPGGLLKAAESPTDGWLGAPVLARFSLRFDLPRRRLLLKRP